MTRINLVPPSELADQHLLAEYKEIHNVGSMLEKSMKSPRWQKTLLNLPEQFTLNEGHVKFFYDKGYYLYRRFNALQVEIAQRGFKYDVTREFDSSVWPFELFNDWTPTEADMELVRRRIRLRISQYKDPSWYRWTGRSRPSYTIMAP